MLDKAKSLVPVIKEIIELYNAHSKFRDEFKSRNADLSDIELYDKTLRDEDYKKSELITVNRMEEMSNEDVTLIEAIMYVGRDNKYEYEKNYDTENELQNELYSMLTSFYNNFIEESKENKIQHMLGKGPFSQYLEDGMRLLKL